MSFYRFMKNFEGEKSHFGDLFEGMKDINFPENITTPREIMEKFQHWLQEPSLHDTIQDVIKQYQNK
ncbi:sterile alpha motif-like domain-containing protein [Staphylococcus epidermidis]|uniref:sterile alpha motif-like domain-containing protein n=1 Tax=Staphylococcus epidermidis TaxID=1282 RepID=UPI001117F6EC|nr:sterile alpha motif-like domain-containing protein [Staphylococcus epidermidis]MBM5983813.1 sterile alpha motif-like domain-containing protein [Staphylococcus epidermidis]MBM5986039.1 sterile alpha motif-like domain-containing protein [Staphylococcus epidermidis]MBM5990452.1 sterile alpha motif-like domain-containing protein [Staphylococcus epidermidis]MBM5997206.1 sterile alpha motif-like domain-containing protein [Staphylococcus epidermidis]MBM6001587.1 sterile alpha motif-like domain-con